MAAPAITLRATSPADRDFFFETRRDAFRAYAEQAFGPWDDDKQRASAAKDFDELPIRIIERDRVPIGYQILLAHDDHWFLDEIALVVPPHALDHTVTLSARREPMDAPAGPAFTVAATVQVSFGATPADVTLHFDAAVHTHPADVYAATLVSGVWHQLPRPAGDSGTSGVAHGVTTDVGTFGVIECPAGVCP
jgi:hypothetical protein